MNKIFEDINEAFRSFSYFKKGNNEYFNFIYPYTTENINGYLSQIDVKDKSILTVCGSGDHILNLILSGAKKVDVFDISCFSKYYMNLKIAAFKALEYEEFFEYFCYMDYIRICKNNKKAFNIESYWKITPYLDKYTKMFWDNLYLEFNGLDIRKNDLLFSRDEEKPRVLKHLNKYLDKNNFYKLKEILSNTEYKINFYNKNIKDLPNVLTDKYDLILTSNISQYLFEIYKDDENLCLMEYKKLIDELSNSLNKDGKILVGYFYDIKNSVENQRTNDDISFIYDFPKFNKTFNNNLEYIYFNSPKDILHELNGKIIDSVAVYKKQK